ncbi:phosphoglycan beta 1,3 galactosyltransferase 1 [Leishmania tarentolae]|uniref:Phosphoglycan beta 1,3 galactosyltransferase 1 n=1 Tax=Leishmania tarentolae TaxID=5689 RepID=A0A640KF56_LEITA|nr:phosphoglycan beta 1,3 galactosyltransferase 1 [Leishmania tarentolae]
MHHEDGAPEELVPTETHRVGPSPLILVSERADWLNSCVEDHQRFHTPSCAKLVGDPTRAPDCDNRNTYTPSPNDDISSAVVDGVPLRYSGSSPEVPAQFLRPYTQRRRLVELAILFGFLATAYWSFKIFSNGVDSREQPPIQLPTDAVHTGASLSLFSVVVQHESAFQRLKVSQPDLASADADSLTRVNLDVLPSWTLRLIKQDCTMCFDNVTYAPAVDTDLGRSTDKKENQSVEAFHVFARTSAPLGLMGPMLFAMASVTDDIDFSVELPRWNWVTWSYEQQHRFVRGSNSASIGQRPRHLIVMGVPSTDHSTSSALRDAQRSTWLTYREVARSDNNFTGALLQLYIFSGGKPYPESKVYPPVDMAQLAPTVSEYVAASAQRLAVQNRDFNNATSYVQRRVVLRDGWRGMERDNDTVWKSPCTGVSTSAAKATSPGNATSSLETLSAHLRLPVTPAFTSPAQYVCHASTALWQEALHYRNVLWLDFLTERRPRTKKKMGKRTSSKTPEEIGISQMVVIWLNYAYTAFPDVPYIMKGDDHLYLKVPQYLSDLRHVRTGWDKPRNLTATIPHGGVIPAPLGIDDKEDCLYRIWWRHSSHIVYGNGAGYMLDRRLIQAVMNPFDDFNALLLKLLINPYNSSLHREYLSLTMQFEDMLVGRQLQDHVDAVKEVCPNEHLCYMSDRLSRAHQILGPKSPTLTWTSEMTQVGMPAILYYIHYFHNHEFKEAENADQLIKQGIKVKTIERDATRLMYDWVASRLTSTVLGVGTPLNLDWVRGDARTAYTVAEGDDVAVYDVPYKLVKRKKARCILESGKK